MAEPWIKMRISLGSCPKVVRILSALQADRFRTVGGLHAVWALFDLHSVDGVMDGYTLSSMSQMIGWPGFAEAMASVGWLEQTDAGLVMPRFSDHNGASAKRRAMDAYRKTKVRKMSAPHADKDRTKCGLEKEKEKEKEEKTENPPHIPPQGDEPKPTPTAKFDPAQGWPWTDPEFQSAVDGWVKHRREIGHPIKPTSHARQVKDCRDWGRERALAALVESTRSGYQGLFPAKGGFGPSRPSAIEEAQKVTERMRSDGVADRTISRLMADLGATRPGTQPEIFPALGEPRRVS